jgi:hypothetical protein
MSHYLCPQNEHDRTMVMEDMYLSGLQYSSFCVTFGAHTVGNSNQRLDVVWKDNVWTDDCKGELKVKTQCLII